MSSGAIIQARSGPTLDFEQANAGTDLDAVTALYNDARQGAGKGYLLPRTVGELARHRDSGLLTVAWERAHVDSVVPRGLIAAAVEAPDLTDRLLYHDTLPLARALAAAALTGHAAQLCCLAVDPNYRGRGLAARLVARAEETVCTRGLTHVFAYSVIGNELALGVFMRGGYTVIGTARRREKTPHGQERPGLQRWVLAKALEG